MIKIEKLLSAASEREDFYFLTQRTVKLVVVVGNDVVERYLSKDDVIKAINYYIAKIKIWTDDEIRCSDMNYHAFKMYDLVPYLYTLVNYYLSLLCNDTVCYERFLPELKIKRFCHLPFEKEILPSVKQDLVIMCSLLPDALTGKSYYMCYVDHFSYSSESVDNLLSDIRSCDPYLFRTYNVILKVVGSYGKE